MAELLTYAEAGERLGLTETMMTELVDSDRMPSVITGDGARILPADVEAYREKRRRDRKAGLAAMVEISEKMGLYDEPAASLPAPRR